MSNKKIDFKIDFIPVPRKSYAILEIYSNTKEKSPIGYILLKTFTARSGEAEQFFNTEAQEISGLTNHSIGINMYSTNMIEDMAGGIIPTYDGVLDEKFDYAYTTKNNLMMFKLIDILKKIHKEVTI